MERDICEEVSKGKTSWPELVGVKGEDAVATIERENCLVHAETILEGTPITKIFLCDRVLVWVNKKGVTVQAPHNG